MLKGQKKHKDKEQGKTKHEAPRSVNYRATQNKNNIRTSALERSVVYTTGGFNSVSLYKLTLGPDIIRNTKQKKKKKKHEKISSHNGFLSQSMHLSENTKSNRSLLRNKERVLLANPHCKQDLKETTSWVTMAQAKDIASSPKQLVKALCRGRNWVWGPTRRHVIKEWSIAINRG